jgi:phosphatidylserine decarboxylase
VHLCQNKAKKAQMKFHREGYPSLFVVLVLGSLLHLLGEWLGVQWLSWLLDAAAVFLLVVVVQFFRSPSRKLTLNSSAIIAPADGKVVVIERVYEPEVLKAEAIQVSIFMSPVNVHINRFPISGQVSFFQYHPGKFLVAWHPKSSTENERTTIAVQHSSGKQVMFRQIAGALARRICWYCKEGDAAQQGSEFGFIKFGSRVDLFLPVDTTVTVKLNEVVKGGVTPIGDW